LSVAAAFVRQRQDNPPKTGATAGGARMRYALLIYNSMAAAEARRDEEWWPIAPAIAAILERPSVTGWLRLRDSGSATTLTNDGGRMLLSDGPFVESKEYLAGLITIDAANLDEALALATELQETRTGGAIEVRPALD
jgi:hypothetical protein